MVMQPSGWLQSRIAAVPEKTGLPISGVERCGNQIQFQTSVETVGQQLVNQRPGIGAGLGKLRKQVF